MMNIEDVPGPKRGFRHGWEFIYTGAQLLKGATTQKEFRLAKVKTWQDAKASIMAEIRSSGIEVNESVASQMTNYGGSNRKMAPSIRVRDDLEDKLVECHGKIQEHQQATDEYVGWIQVLEDNQTTQYKLNYSDWLYFFRTA